VWDASLAALFETGASTVTWDLGQVVSVRLLAIQADANDTYNVWGSLDGKEYKVMGRSTPSLDTGCVCAPRRGGMAARFLRVGEGKGDSFYSVSEVAAYCQTPTPFPPQMKSWMHPRPRPQELPRLLQQRRQCPLGDDLRHVGSDPAVVGASSCWPGHGGFKLRLRRILLGVMGCWPS